MDRLKIFPNGPDGNAGLKSVEGNYKKINSEFNLEMLS